MAASEKHSPVLTESWSNEIGFFLQSSNLEVSNSTIFPCFISLAVSKTQNLQYLHCFIIKNMLPFYIKAII